MDTAAIVFASSDVALNTEASPVGALQLLGTQVMAKRIRIGDIVEISTSRGLAYAQYTHKDESWGALLRVLPGFFDQRPQDFEHLVRQQERFVSFFPLGAAVSQGIVQLVGNEPVPRQAERLPDFRWAGFIDRQGNVRDWWIGEGGTKRKVTELTPEQRKMPILEVINDTLLIDRIENDWTPERDRQ